MFVSTCYKYIVAQRGGPQPRQGSWKRYKVIPGGGSMNQQLRTIQSAIGVAGGAIAANDEVHLQTDYTEIG